MLQEQCKVGMRVYFGRKHGEKTLGVIVRLNPKKAKVKTLEDRGSRHVAGVEWGVPYSMMTPADADVPIQKEKLTYSPFAGEDNLILEAIVACHSGLSPENLACDGEASRSHIRTRGAELTRKLKHLQLALGREVDEIEAYEWSDSKAKYQRERQRQG